MKGDEADLVKVINQAVAVAHLVLVTLREPLLNQDVLEDQVMLMVDEEVIVVPG